MIHKYFFIITITIILFFIFYLNINNNECFSTNKKSHITIHKDSTNNNSHIKYGSIYRDNPYYDNYYYIPKKNINIPNLKKINNMKFEKRFPSLLEQRYMYNDLNKFCSFIDNPNNKYSFKESVDYNKSPAQTLTDLPLKLKNIRNAQINNTNHKYKLYYDAHPYKYNKKIYAHNPYHKNYSNDVISFEKHAYHDLYINEPSIFELNDVIY